MNEHDDIVCTGISKKERNVEVRVSRMHANARLMVRVHYAFAVAPLIFFAAGLR